MDTPDRWRFELETERTVVVVWRQGTLGWCERCGHEVEFLRTEATARSVGVRPEEIQQKIDHVFHVGRMQGSLAICLKSLMRFLRANGDSDDVPNLPTGGRR